MGRDYSAQNNSQILTKAGRLTGKLKNGVWVGGSQHWTAS